MLYIGETGRQLRTRLGEHHRGVSANDANQPAARHFNSGSHCISDMKIRALCPISGNTDSRKRQEMRLMCKLGTVHPLGINERFPSFSVTCLCLTCSDIDRSNPTFVFIVLLALFMPSHITPIAFCFFIPCFDQILLIGFYFVTCCFNIFTCIKTRVLSPTPPPPHTSSRRRAFARNVESVCIA